MLSLMAIDQALDNLTKNIPRISSELLSSAKGALLDSVRVHGDYPTNATIIEKVKDYVTFKNLSSSALSAQIAFDPILALRVLSHVQGKTSAGKPEVHSLARAIDLIGLEEVVDVFQNLSVAINSDQTYLGRGVASTALQQIIVASIICRQIVQAIAPDQSLEEEAYISSVLSNIPALLSSFYHPAIYSAIYLDCLEQDRTFSDTFDDIFRGTAENLSDEVTKLLNLPQMFGQVLSLAGESPKRRADMKRRDSKVLDAVASAVYLSNKLAEEICSFRGVQGLQRLIANLAEQSTVGQERLEDIVGLVADKYYKYCLALDLCAFRLPDYLSWFQPTVPEVEQADYIGAISDLPNVVRRMNPFLYEIRSCFRVQQAGSGIGRLPQAVFCTLSSLIKGLNFDRALFLRPTADQKELAMVLVYGAKVFSQERKNRKRDPEKADLLPDVRAWERRECVFEGQSIFRDAWPFFAFPAIAGNRVIGVFYAEKLKRPESAQLTDEEKFVCEALASEWAGVPEEME